MNQYWYEDFLFLVLLEVPLASLVLLILCLIFAYLHRRYLRRNGGYAPQKWRRNAVIAMGALSAANLIAGICFWFSFLCPG